MKAFNRELDAGFVESVPAQIYMGKQSQFIFSSTNNEIGLPSDDDCIQLL